MLSTGYLSAILVAQACQIATPESPAEESVLIPDFDPSDLFETIAAARMHAYLLSDTSQPEWTGNVGACDPGEVNPEYRRRALYSVNLLRVLSGIDQIESLDCAMTRDSQHGILVNLALGPTSGLVHNLDPAMPCYTVAAQRGAIGNLYSTRRPPGAARAPMRAVSRWVQSTGHRAWLLYPKLTKAGFGVATNAQAAKSSFGWFGGVDQEQPDRDWAHPPNGYLPLSLARTYNTVRGEYRFSDPSDLSQASVFAAPDPHAATKTPLSVIESDAHSIVFSLAGIPPLSDQGNYPSTPIRIRFTVKNVLDRNTGQPRKVSWSTFLVQDDVRLVGEGLRFTAVTRTPDSWTSIPTNVAYADPVVILQASTRHEAEPYVLTVRNRPGQPPEARLLEFDYTDGVHAEETVQALVLEAGTHRMRDGLQVEAGHLVVPPTGTEVAYDPAQGRPTMLFQLRNSDEPLILRAQHNPENSTFHLLAVREEANTSPVPNIEVDYALIWLRGRGATGQELYQTERIAGLKSIKKNHRFEQEYPETFLWGRAVSRNKPDPAYFRIKKLNRRRARIYMQEEKSFTEEVRHGAEVVNILAVNAENERFYLATAPGFEGPDPAPAARPDGASGLPSTNPGSGLRWFGE